MYSFQLNNGEHRVQRITSITKLVTFTTSATTFYKRIYQLTLNRLGETLSIRVHTPLSIPIFEPSLSNELISILDGPLASFGDYFYDFDYLFVIMYGFISGITI